MEETESESSLEQESKTASAEREKSLQNQVQEHLQALSKRVQYRKKDIARSSPSQKRNPYANWTKLTEAQRDSEQLLAMTEMLLEELQHLQSPLGLKPLEVEREGKAAETTALQPGVERR